MTAVLVRRTSPRVNQIGGVALDPVFGNVLLWHDYLKVNVRGVTSSIGRRVNLGTTLDLYNASITAQQELRVRFVVGESLATGLRPEDAVAWCAVLEDALPGQAPFQFTYTVIPMPQPSLLTGRKRLERWRNPSTNPPRVKSSIKSVIPG